MITMFVISVVLEIMNMCCWYAISVIFIAVIFTVMKNLMELYLRMIGIAFIVGIEDRIELVKIESEEEIHKVKLLGRLVEIMEIRE